MRRPGQSDDRSDNYKRDFARLYFTNTVRETVRRASQAAILKPAEVRRQLERLRADLMREALTYFFHPSELSLYKLIVLINGKTEIFEHEHVRVLGTVEELRAADWELGDNDQLFDRLILSRDFAAPLAEDDELRRVVAEARRYRQYLMRAVRRDSAIDKIGLEEDRVALAELDRLFGEMAGAAKFCAEHLI